MNQRQTFEYPGASSLTSILESAAEFGMTPDEIWKTVMATPDRLPTEIKARYLDELSGGLARRLVEKQRES